MAKKVIPPAISEYMAELARKGNAKMVKGSPKAKARTAKAREVLKAIRAARKEAMAKT